MQALLLLIHQFCYRVAPIGSVFLFLALTTLLTQPVQAESLEVTATVQAPLPTSPAIILSPSDQEHVTHSPLTVSGTCGDGAYVKVYNNGSSAGVGSCAGGTFAIQVSLAPDANELQARVYNITDNEGPQGPAVTVYYDVLQPSVPPPVETPLSLRIISVDSVPYTPGLTYSTSLRPTIKGYAPPYSEITIAFSPGDAACRSTTDAKGSWSCTLAASLQSGGRYTVRVSSLSPQNLVSTVPNFVIITSSTTPSLLQPADTRPPLTLHYEYNYMVYRVGQAWKGEFRVQGDTPPYTITVEWGDGTTTTQAVASPGAFTLTHTFTRAGSYQPIVRAADKAGNSTSLQVLVVVEGAKAGSFLSQTSTAILFSVVIILGLTIFAEVFGATSVLEIHHKKDKDT